MVSSPPPSCGLHFNCHNCCHKRQLYCPPATLIRLQLNDDPSRKLNYIHCNPNQLPIPLCVGWYRWLLSTAPHHCHQSKSTTDVSNSISLELSPELRPSLPFRCYLVVRTTEFKLYWIPTVVSNPSCSIPNPSQILSQKSSSFDGLSGY